MNELPDFAKLSDATLHQYKAKFNTAHEFHEGAITELCRRQTIKEQKQEKYRL
ncbi:MAG: hypothetical protein V3U15_03775 [Nitrospinota bacterium]